MLSGLLDPSTLPSLEDQALPRLSPRGGLGLLAAERQPGLVNIQQRLTADACRLDWCEIEARSGLASSVAAILPEMHPFAHLRELSARLRLESYGILHDDMRTIRHAVYARKATLGRVSQRSNETRPLKASLEACGFAGLAVETSQPCLTPDVGADNVAQLKIG